MALPPEIILDRYLRSSRSSKKDRGVYRGKQRLDLLEPEFRSLLIGVQNTVNEALRQRGNTFAKGRYSNFHFDYIDATVRNALAFEHADYAFIVVTLPLVRALWHTCDRLSRSDKVRETLGVMATEEQREGTLAVLFITQLAFVVAHEFAHHDRGHFPQGDSATGLWNEIPDEETVGSLEQQAKEVDADLWAVYLVLTHLMRDRRQGTREILNLQAAPNPSFDEILLASFVFSIAGLLFIFPPTAFSGRDLYLLTHPPQAARMNEIMHGVRMWCARNAPALGAWMTLERFQVLMHASREATSGLTGVLHWSQQTEFFLTQAGTEYFRKLQGQIILLMNEEGPATKSGEALSLNAG
jgi:hypothetical protein